MKKITAIAVVLLSLLLGASCYKSKKQTASLRFDWFTSMTFSGEVWGYEEFAKKNNLDLKLEPGSESTDPVKLVIGGANDFGCISVEKFLAANEKGADIVAVGVINQLSPTVFVSKKEKNILTPKDWIGKRVGVLPGGATEYVYRSLLRKVGITTSQFTEVTVPFDLVTFIADKYDVRPAFVYDEPVSLELQNVAYTLIEPKDYGINYVGRVYFAKRELIKKNPELVQKFINTMADGWNASMARPEDAIANLKKFEPKTDSVRDLASLKKAKPYYVDSNGKVLTFNYTYWDSTVQELNQLGILKTTNYRDFIDESFIKKYYSEK
jgi:ABC-type nitrate/sulfonate/bicarbonate transport system substrate-binding protein